MVTVGISGAPGRMGRLTIAAIAETDDLRVGALYAPRHDGEDIDGHSCSGDPAALAGCDVIVEFTNPDVSPDNVERWRDTGAHVLVGTSGYTTDRLDELQRSWEHADADQRCLVVPNFAVGAVLMMRFAELAAPHFAGAEIIEIHHHDKPDAPSGTALSTAARMAAARNAASPHRGTEIAPGALGSNVEGIAVHSLRLEGSIAHQEVVLGTTGQMLTIRHDTTDYAAFAPGILLALRNIADLPDPVTVGLESLLGV